MHLSGEGAQRVRAEVEVRHPPPLCAGESATGLSEAAPAGPPLRAAVTAIGVPANATRGYYGGEIRDRGAAVLPIGASATVRFDPCPPKMWAGIYSFS